MNVQTGTGPNFEPASTDEQNTYATRNQLSNPKPGLDDMLRFADQAGNQISHNSEPRLPAPKTQY